MSLPARWLQDTGLWGFLTSPRRLSFSSLFGACCLFAAKLHAQQPDDFIKTIEKIKTGIAPVTCAHATVSSKFDVGIRGTAFFIDSHGAFLTAAHVVKGVEDKGCETPAVLVRADEAASGNLNFYGLKFLASDCRIDETADIARCQTVEDPTGAKKIVTKPGALTITSDVQPDGTPVAFSGFSLDGLMPYTARANVAGYQVIEMSPKQGLQVHMLVLDKPAWTGASGGPVYGIDGRVMGMLLRTGSGFAFARHGGLLKEFLSGP
jgi:S1-C subfamily serine protease